MIHQAQSYFAGAASSAALIAASVAAFVLLASLTAFHEWPAPDMGGSDEGITTVSTGPPPAEQAAANALAPAAGFVASVAPSGQPLNTGPAGVPATGPNGTQVPDGSLPPQGPAPPSTNPTTFTPSGTPSPPQSPTLSQNLSETVNNAAGQADQASGGSLSDLGVNQTVQGATGALLGPGTAGGNTVDNVGHLLGN